jgi:hypothetical protein
MTDGRPTNEDRPDPNDRPPQLRARVPEHVADGAFSSGAIVVTGPTEFIIDFLQTVGRPHKVAARVVMPHAVMAQFVEALAKNLSLYRERFGDPPQPPGVAGPATSIGPTGTPREFSDPKSAARQAANQLFPFGSTDVLPGAPIPELPTPRTDDPPGTKPLSSPSAASPSPITNPVNPQSPSQGGLGQGGLGQGGLGQAGLGQAGPVTPPPAPRRPTPQEIYDDLKIPDSILSGAYANGVMIAHGASEFGLDFLTSFYPQSAVSARVFMAAGQIPRLLESLQQSLRQWQAQRGPNPGGPNPGPTPS